MDKKYVIGIDFGGTKIALALCDLHCNLFLEDCIKTDPTEGGGKVVDRMLAALHRLIEESGAMMPEIAAIGICSPGPLSVEEGRIIYIASIGLRDVPIRSVLENEFNIPVFLENDANSAAYAERFLGAGKSLRENGILAYVTVSTGIGCGIVIGDNILHGMHDSAGELGHVCIENDGRQCSCGNKGCLETYASGTALARIARERVRSIPEGRDSILLHLADGDIERIDCLTLQRAAENGDEDALEIWMEMSSRLGQGLSIVMQMFDPDMIVIGGGVSRAWHLFYHKTIASIKKHSYRILSKDIHLVPAGLNQKAGVLGAALIAIRMTLA